ncbi:hypothetical protein D3C81_1491880 [compost metagenome]
MHQRDDGADGELPLEAEADVDQDATESQQHAQATLVAQLFTDLRADELHPLQARHVAGIGQLQGSSDLLAQFRIVAGHAHQHVLGIAEALHYGIGVARFDQLLANLAQFGRLLVGELDQRTAGEVQAEVDALGEPAEQRKQGQGKGGGERNIAYAHEVDSSDLDVHRASP